MKNKKRFKSFDDFEDAKKTRGRLESYPPTKFVVQPAANDKIYLWVKAQFDKLKE